MAIQSQNSGVNNLTSGSPPAVPQAQAAVVTAERPSIEERILQDIMSCDATRKLWQEAIATPNPEKLSHIPERHWTLKLTQNPKTATHFDRQMITVNSEFSYAMALAATIFELTNVKKAQMFYQIHQNLINGKISVEDFVLDYEFQEFHGVQEHHRIVSKAMIQMGWSAEVDIFRRMGVASWEEYMEHQEKCGHAAGYRKGGRALVRQRVHKAMRSVGYTQAHIHSFNQRLLEEISYERDDSALRDYLHEIRTMDIMSQIGCSDAEIDVWDREQLIDHSSKYKTEEELRVSLLRWRVHSAMRTLHFTEEEISSYPDDLLPSISNGRDPLALVEYFLQIKNKTES
jgi:uncharacterized protein YggL (DUF469 family)